MSETQAQSGGQPANDWIESVEELAVQLDWGGQNYSVEQLRALFARISPEHQESETVIAALATMGVHFACEGDTERLRAVLDLPQAAAVARRKVRYPSGHLGPKTWILMAAAGADQEDCVEIALPFSDAKETDEEGRTPLHVAALRGPLRCVELLLPKSDPNAQDKKGRTPLEIAVDHRCDWLAPTLLAATDPSRVDNEGRTILERALFNNDAPLVATLLRRCDPRALNEEKSAIERQLENLNLYDRPERGPCTDLLADHMDAAELEVAFHRLGRGHAPRVAAHLDADQQRRALLEAAGEGETSRTGSDEKKATTDGRRPRSL
jgi:uncharacterized protein